MSQLRIASGVGEKRRSNETNYNSRGRMKGHSDLREEEFENVRGFYKDGSDRQIWLRTEVRESFKSLR
jgi:hypothetical protein